MHMATGKCYARLDGARATRPVGRTPESVVDTGSSFTLDVVGFTFCNVGKSTIVKVLLFMSSLCSYDINQNFPPTVWGRRRLVTFAKQM